MYVICPCRPNVATVAGRRKKEAAGICTPIVLGFHIWRQLRTFERVAEKGGPRNLYAICPWRPNLATVTHF